MAEPRSLSDWASLLATNWEARARLPSRDLFVASHPGWNDPVAWEAHARTEAELFLSGLDPERLRAADLLEIGCGSGRLVTFLRDRVRSYTGFDIAAGMVEAATRRCRGLDRVRFFAGDGLGVPAAARDRAYGLVVAVAVFIHCPREVIAANVQSAWTVLAPGGQLRLQVLADPDDREGIIAPAAQAQAAAAAIVADMQGVIASLTPAERALVFDTYYMGARFRYAEVAPFLRALTGGEIQLYRGDPGAIYAAVARPA
jgi:SAM-dependent methyltransferase